MDDFAFSFTSDDTALLAISVIAFAKSPVAAIIVISMIFLIRSKKHMEQTSQMNMLSKALINFKYHAISQLCQMHS